MKAAGGESPIVFFVNPVGHVPNLLSGFLGFSTSQYGSYPTICFQGRKGTLSSGRGWGTDTISVISFLHAADFPFAVPALRLWLKIVVIRADVYHIIIQKGVKGPIRLGFFGNVCPS